MRRCAEVAPTLLRRKRDGHSVGDAAAKSVMWHHRVRIRRKAPWSRDGLLTEEPFTGKTARGLGEPGERNRGGSPRERSKALDASRCPAGAGEVVPGERHGVLEDGSMPVKAPPAPRFRSAWGPGSAMSRKGHHAPTTSACMARVGLG